ncbi:MAG TPA: hypothetical protein VF540_05070, partial [Segetibacter sp.]
LAVTIWKMVTSNHASLVISSSEFIKSRRLIERYTSWICSVFFKLRNKAFHAQFNKIEVAEILSLISFVQQFLI